LATTKVSDTLCAAAPLDQCSCKCLHAAQWTCEEEAVVCKARYGHEDLKTVGDKVCETRGAPKPTNVAELRVASTCTPVTEMRGSAPSSMCLDQWATPEPTTKAPTTEAPPTTLAPATEAPATDTSTGNGDTTDSSSTDTSSTDTSSTDTKTSSTPEPATPTAKPIVIAESFAAAMAFAALAIHA